MYTVVLIGYRYVDGEFVVTIGQRANCRGTIFFFCTCLVDENLKKKKLSLGLS